VTAPERVTPLAFLDTETTGLDPRHHEVWEVAVVRAEHRPGRLLVLDEYVRQIDVHHLEDADPYGLEVGGFHSRRLPQSQRIRPKGAAAEIEKRTRGRMMVGAVPSFDSAFLTKLLHEQGRPVTWHYQLIDVETLVAGYLAADALNRDRYQDAAQPPWHSDALLELVGVTVPEVDRHTALGDARWAMRAYAAVFGLEVIADD